MLFERFDDKGLSQYSYAVGCEGAGAVAIVDPRRDVDVYLEFAASRHLLITHVLETHIHADFASGAHELAERTGATLCLSGYDTGEVYEASFPHTPLEDGASLSIGRVRIEAMHTPGHTPEHMAYLVYDTARSSSVPELFLTGDFVFVGSLGRPDLIGEEAKHGLARQQYDSVQKTRRLPDGLEVHPGHGAGSMCGAGMSGRPMSTLGFERSANPYLDPALTREAFVARLLGHVPPFPPYYRRMKALNAKGAPTLAGLPGQTPLAPAAFRERVAAGHVVIDLRGAEPFGRGHVPDAFGIGADAKLSTWASWVVPYDTPILLVADQAGHVPEAVRALVRVGLDDVQGCLDGGMAAWRAAGFDVETVENQSPAELHAAREAAPSIRVVDVRNDDEWRTGHVCGAAHVMAGDLPARAPALAADEAPLAVICGTGYRSTVAASVLKRAGVSRVINVTGGMVAWQAAGLRVCKD